MFLSLVAVVHDAVIDDGCLMLHFKKERKGEGVKGRFHQTHPRLTATHVSPYRGVAINCTHNLAITSVSRVSVSRASVPLILDVARASTSRQDHWKIRASRAYLADAIITLFQLHDVTRVTSQQAIISDDIKPSLQDTTS
jgi:hypothetical protein